MHFTSNKVVNYTFWVSQYRHLRSLGNIRGIPAAGLMLATYLVLLVTSALWLVCVRRVSLVSALRAKLVKYLCCSILDTQEHINIKLSLTLNVFI